MQAHIAQAIAQAGGWLGFDRFMALALYTPGLGYYAHDSLKFGAMPTGAGLGSDFVTAPELSPLFGRTLAAQVGEALRATDTDEVWEFGAGTGALALQLLEQLGDAVRRYTIVDLSGSLRARQQATLQRHAHKLQWADALPAQIHGVVVGNEVLDAMPVQLLQRRAGVWHERGVALAGDGFAWHDRPTDLRPPVPISGPHDYLTEIHAQGQAFVRTLADHVVRGAALMLDYGFPEAEYYHPQRSGGTVMCHQAHRADADPLADVGAKDITAHVDFSGIAVAAQDAGWDVLGYTSQARFLINCGLVQRMEAAELAQRSMAHRLIAEHEMGELFKVLALSKGVAPWDALGFTHGDRSHTL
ncbi:class I SAM-dependent methyltransferase [Pseudorhodoferax sp. Leaf267]|uniref:class I SAM-dependent methyltransferase n=1 Tax=Pseudorhodoferax sp. Leaf267 TaxID=1736316 RepID=UPI000ADC6B38|nr:SAM-dependent methyltransferase [Pseudorhodoferax sp. Leaf267]